MKQRLKIVQHNQQLRAQGLKEGHAAQHTGETFGCLASSVRSAIASHVSTQKKLNTQTSSGFLIIPVIEPQRRKALS